MNTLNDKLHICCICGKVFKTEGNDPTGAMWVDGHGKTKSPKFQAGDRCCDKCNANFVVPGRFYKLMHKTTAE